VQQLDAYGIPPDGIGDACRSNTDEVCSFYGLDFCTSALGGSENQPPHAFCTRKCDPKLDDCGTYRTCTTVPWSLSPTRVCVPNEWLNPKH
jgi:hypothetical protein